MKIGIMQPYLFPYIGYVQLIHQTDVWVIFDDTQYISKGWINRNRILHPDPAKEWQYFTVPVRKHTREHRIHEIEINEDRSFRDEILGKLSAYKKKAPNYNETVEFVRGCLNYKHKNLAIWIAHTLKELCSYLEIPFQYYFSSEMTIPVAKISHPGQWALEIAHLMGASEYVNPPGGFGIFIEQEFLDRDIRLSFLRPDLNPYIQRRDGFVPGLSIIDVMMWNTKAEIHQMLQEFEILSHSQLMSETALES